MKASNVARPNLFSVFNWADFEQYVLTTFENALRELRRQSSLPRPENRLNRELYRRCLQCHKDLAGHANHFPMVIILDASNQPQPDDSAIDDRLRMRPDFQCILHNPLAECAEQSQVFYIIECKRLGEPDRADWIFNENYSRHGILRFREASHAYAKGFASAAMIGYLQSMQPNAVLNEVNKAAEVAGFPAISRPEIWRSNDVTRLPPQEFGRSFPVEAFRLRHLWVDLRDSA